MAPGTPSEESQKIPLLCPGVFGTLAVIFSVSTWGQQLLAKEPDWLGIPRTVGV
jgi:hypothetical protein